MYRDVGNNKLTVVTSITYLGKVGRAKRSVIHHSQGLSVFQMSFFPRGGRGEAFTPYSPGFPSLIHMAVLLVSQVVCLHPV